MIANCQAVYVHVLECKELVSRINQCHPRLFSTKSNSKVVGKHEYIKMNVVIEKLSPQVLTGTETEQLRKMHIDILIDFFFDFSRSFDDLCIFSLGNQMKANKM